MTVLDDKIIPKVVTILAKYGKTVTLVDDRNIVDPVNSTITRQTIIQPVKATPPDANSIKYLGSDVKVAGATAIFVSPVGLTLALKTGLKVNIDDVVWTVMQVSPIYSGEEIALYGLLLNS